MEKRTANGPKKNSLGTGESVRVSGYLVRVSPNRLLFYRLNLRRFIQRSSDKGGDGGLQRTLFRVTENANDAPFAWKWVIFIIFVWIRIGAGEIKKSYFQENLYDAKVFVAQQKRQKGWFLVTLNIKSSLCWIDGPVASLAIICWMGVSHWFSVCWLHVALNIQ